MAETATIPPQLRAFTPQTASVAGAIRKRASHSQQAKKLAETCFAMAMEIRSTTALPSRVQDEDPGPAERRADAQAIANLVRSWDTCLDRLRVLRGKPAPGQYRPEAPPPKPSKPKNRPPGSRPIPSSQK
jgi:hypothetical protein